MERHKRIIKTSLIAMLTNIILGLIKILIGILSHSLVILLDALNNFSDALSSLITFIGTKLAHKRPDKKHPMGYGRIEFMTSLIIALFVFYAGVKSIQESISTVFSNTQPHYELLSLVILAFTIFIKMILGRYMLKVGKQTNSHALINSAQDASHDAILSTSTIIFTFIFLGFHISLEGYLGFILSIILLKSAYDLFLSSYGPVRYQGSVHIAVFDILNAVEIDHISHKIEKLIYQKYYIRLTGIGIYAIHTKEEEALKLQQEIENMIKDYNEIIQMHRFYFDKNNKHIQFDIIVDFDYPDFDENIIHNALQKKLPNYTIQINKDLDMSD